VCMRPLDLHLPAYLAYLRACSPAGHAPSTRLLALFLQFVALRADCASLDALLRSDVPICIPACRRRCALPRLHARTAAYDRLLGSAPLNSQLNRRAARPRRTEPGVRACVEKAIAAGALELESSAAGIVPFAPPCSTASECHA